MHLANNLFKLALVGRDASFDVVARFAIPGAAGAFAGAWLLGRLSGHGADRPLVVRRTRFVIAPINLVLGVLIAGFALLEVSQRAEALTFGRRSLPLGGLLSGFFGGLSGHQGALRSAFLLRLGLSKQAFIGTSVVAAVVVDLARLAVYGSTFFARDFATLREGGGEGLVVAAVAAAWLGSFVGARLVRSVTLRALQVIVAGMLLLVAALLATGLI